MKTTRLQPNPEKRPNGHALTVIDPRTGRAFPSGPFELDAAALRDPRILRLLPPEGAPGGVAGGRDGDLVPAPVSRKSRSAAAAKPQED